MYAPIACSAVPEAYRQSLQRRLRESCNGQLDAGLMRSVQPFVDDVGGEFWQRILSNAMSSTNAPAFLQGEFLS